ncbi:MAG TPA: hypothetical protein VLF59_02360 [Candidatus Saccharimonadales bacterium]|nr:hypothetical protein [Candidatus Saccharimonadales bacterium]
MLPFFLATLYQLHMLRDHEAKPALLSLLVHTRQFYTIGLPSIGLSVAIITIAWSLFKSERYWRKNWLQLLREAWHNSLLIFTGLGLLALAIIC